MKYILILASTLDNYFKGVEATIPGLERYHKIKFHKKGVEFLSDKYVILPALTVDSLQGLHNYQLIKYGNFMANPEADAIIKLYKYDLSKRKIEAPSVGQD